MAINQEVIQVHERLKYIELAPFELLGCPRRNRWSGKARRSDVGAALLALLGSKARFRWDGGEVDVFVTNMGSLLMWRPGPWRDWWADDAQLLMGLVLTRSSMAPPGVLVLHEVDGATQVRYIQFPVPLVEQSFAARNTAWIAGGDTRPPRINRRSEAAFYLCKKCPVRQRCEAQDMADGNTEDWS